MGEFDSVWFFSVPPGRPFNDAGVDASIVDYAIQEAMFNADIVCAAEWCPDRYAFILAVKTSMILYALGEPQNTEAGSAVSSPAGVSDTADDYISFVKSDQVGPLEREYEKPIKATDENSVPKLGKRLADLLDGCNPPKAKGFHSLASLCPPRTNCHGYGKADKTDD